MIQPLSHSCSTSNLLVPAPGQFNIMSARFPGLLLKRMEHIDRVPNRSDVDYPPLPQHADADFPYPRTDRLHWFPVPRLKAVLDRAKLETCCRRASSGKF